MIPLTPLTSARSPDLLLPELSEAVDTEEARVPQPRKNVHRSRIIYALLTLLTFLVAALAASFIWSAVVGYVLWAVFQAGDFNVST
jgi:fatty acid desaturase